MNRASALLGVVIAVLLHLVPLVLFFRPLYSWSSGFLDQQIGGYLVGDYCAAVSSVSAVGVGLLTLRSRSAGKGRVMIVLVISGAAAVLVVTGIVLTPLTGAADYSGPVLFLLGAVLHVIAAIVLLIASLSVRRSQPGLPAG